jgi:prophage regulatory protein
MNITGENFMQAEKNTTQPASLPATGFIRQKQLVAIIPFSRTTLWRKVREGEFPAPVHLSANVTAWKVELIRKWIDDQSPSE